MIRRKNFTNTDPAALPADTEYEECNFARASAIGTDGSRTGVRLWPGDDTPRTFTRCNLVNCEVPPGSTVTDCNTALTTRVEEIDQIEVDGFDLNIVYERAFWHGRYMPDGTIERPQGGPRDDGRERKVD